MATKKKTTKKASKKANKSGFINLRVKLPVAVRVDDYHEFNSIDEYVKALNPKLRFEEVSDDTAFENPYWGIFYYGKPPSNKTVWKLLEDAGAEILRYEDEE